MKNKKALIWTAIAAIAAGTAACGSVTEAPAPAAASSEESTAGTSSQEESSSAETDGMTTLEKIKESGVMVVGTEAAYPPFEYIDESTGEIVGYGRDMLEYIADDLGVEIQQMDLPFQGILPGLEAKKFDFVATTVSVSKERAEKYAFTSPIHEGGNVFIKKKGNDSIPVGDDPDLSGLIVGTQQGSYNDTATQEYNEQLKAEGKEGYKELKLYTTYTEAYVELLNGRVDLAVNGLSAIQYLLKENPDQYELVGKGGPTSYQAWCCRKEDTDLVEFLNGEFKKMKEDGTMAELQMKWFGETIDLPDELPAEFTT